jgi:molybdopterin molybdotransferase
MALLPVDEALRRILDGASALGAERVDLLAAADRVLAEDVAANLTQPPFDASAMDGYAVRAADVATVPAILEVIGESKFGFGEGSQ